MELQHPQGPSLALPEVAAQPPQQPHEQQQLVPEAAVLGVEPGADAGAAHGGEQEAAAAAALGAAIAAAAGKRSAGGESEWGCLFCAAAALLAPGVCTVD